MENKKERKKSSMFPIIAYALVCGIVEILDVYTKGKNPYFIYIKMGMLFFAIGYLVIETVLLLKKLRSALSRWYKNWNPIIWTIVITLAIPVVIHLGIYNGESINQDSFLSAYTEYLSFVGAFALGYFLYKREEIKRHEELKKKARLIYESIIYIKANFRNIEAFINRGETYPIVENWRSEYLDIKHLVTYLEPALHQELKYFFNSVDSINKAIVAGDKERAKKMYLNFEQNEKYSSSAYNSMDAAEVLLFISLDMPQQKPWNEAEKVQIEEYADKFFDVVNLWIYNYLIKNHLTSCDLDLVEYDLVEWLLKHPELRAWVRHSYEKRKITAVVFTIASTMNKKSPNLNYCWREFSLK